MGNLSGVASWHWWMTARLGIHQLGIYIDDYHTAFDHESCATVPASEMINELYVAMRIGTGKNIKRLILRSNGRADKSVHAPYFTANWEFIAR